MTGGIFLIQDGILTLVEVKRSKHGRLRREVADQTPDGARSDVAFWPIRRLAAYTGDRCRAGGAGPGGIVAALDNLRKNHSMNKARRT